MLLDFFDLQRFDVSMFRHFGKKVKSVRRSVAGLSNVEPGYFFNRSAGAEGNQKKIMINWFNLFFLLYLANNFLK